MQTTVSFLASQRLNKLKPLRKLFLKPVKFLGICQIPMVPYTVHQHDFFIALPRLIRSQHRNVRSQPRSGGDQPQRVCIRGFVERKPTGASIGDFDRIAFF